MKRHRRYQRIDTKGCTGYLGGDVPLYPTVRHVLTTDDLPTIGEADGKYFPVAEVVSMTLSAQDRDTIATALLFVNAPASLRRRFGV